MKKKANSILHVLAPLLLVVLIFTGCSKKEQSAPPPQAKPVTKAAPPPVQKQSTSAKLPETASPQLDFSAKKDPFKPFMVEPVEQQKAKESVAARSGNLLPIQSYETNKFTVSGIIVGLKENSALIVDPAGRGYVVKEGMAIGNNDGRISRITPSTLEVVERYRDAKGHARKRTVKLTLFKKK